MNKEEWAWGCSINDSSEDLGKRWESQRSRNFRETNKKNDGIMDWKRQQREQSWHSRPWGLREYKWSKARSGKTTWKTDGELQRGFLWKKQFQSYSKSRKEWEMRQGWKRRIHCIDGGGGVCRKGGHPKARKEKRHGRFWPLSKE